LRDPETSKNGVSQSIIRGLTLNVRNVGILPQYYTASQRRRPRL